MMKNNKEFKRLLINYIIGGFVTISIGLLFALLTINLYKNYVIENNAKLIADLTEKYPDKESEIVDLLVKNKGNLDKGYKILVKYDVDKNSLNLIVNNSNFENKIFIVFTIFTLINLFIVTLIYLRYFKAHNRKIDTITKYINNVLNEDYSLNIRDYDEGFYSSLQDDIYKITSRLKEQHEALLKDKKYLEQTLSDISHQLKTPLTSMNVINNLLYDDNLDKEMKKEFLNKNAIQLDRIEWLVTSLLKLSKLESGTIKLKKEKINVNKLINSALNPLRIPIELKNQEIEIIGNKKINIIGDYNWTVEALVNIIKNAHEHTKDGGKIKISYEDNPIYVLISISDNGEGINENDINHIFERFYKGSSNNKESIGIGLNMSKNIIDRQNGEISVESKKNIGTTFNIKFYKSVI